MANFKQYNKVDNAQIQVVFISKLVYEWMHVEDNAECSEAGNILKIISRNVWFFGFLKIHAG